jgi:hypothetical protein
MHRHLFGQKAFGLQLPPHIIGYLLSEDVFAPEKGSLKYKKILWSRRTEDAKDANRKLDKRWKIG